MRSSRSFGGAELADDGRADRMLGEFFDRLDRRHGR
jgi:hypothetical protein